MKTRACGWLGVLFLCGSTLVPGRANAGSGYYYGAHFGSFEFLGDDGLGRFGGYTFGPKAGAYVISSWLALVLDASASFGLVGKDSENWLLNLPTVSIAVGTGFDALMLYAGGAFSLVGLDDFSGSVRLSLGNPYGFGGLQLGYGGVVVRGEFQIGHAFRINADRDYGFTNLQITLGYGTYVDFL